MADSRFAVAWYCDDVRVEIGNKLSLIGIYDRQLFVEKFPALLPKLAFVVSIYTPKDRPFKDLSVSVLQDDQSVLVVHDNPSLFAEQENNVDEDTGLIRFLAIVQSTSLSLTEPCIFRIRVKTEDGVLTANSLRIALAT